MPGQIRPKLRHRINPRLKANKIKFFCLMFCACFFACYGSLAAGASWDDIQSEGDAHQVNGEYYAASEKFKAALDLAAKTKGTNSPQYLKSLARLCAALAIQGNYTQAEPYYKTLLNTEINHPKDGSADPEVGVWYDDLADTYFARLQPSKREISLEHALALKEKIYGKESSQLPRLQSVLIDWYLSHDEAKKALPVALKRLTILEKSRKKNPDAMFSAEFGLAVAYFKLAKYHESLDVLKGASLLKTSPMPINLPELFLKQLSGYCYLKLGETAQAKESFSQLCQFAKKNPTAKLADFQGWQGFGEICASRGDLAGAESQFRRELAEMPASVGKNSPELLIPIASLRAVLKRENKSAEVEKLDAQAKWIKSTNKDTASRIFPLFN